MSCRVGSLRRVAAGVALVSALPAVAGALPAVEHERAGPKPQSARWVPALAVISGPLVNQGTATIQSFNGPVGCTQDSPPCGSLFRDTQGKATGVFTYVGFSAELMTPSFLPIPGRPRFFVHGDASTSFDAVRAIARENEAAGGLVPPINPGTGQPTAFGSASAIRGQGQKTTTEVKPLVISAGAGIAFTIPVGERFIRIKPSFEFMQQQIEVSTFVAKVQSEGKTLHPQLDNRCARAGWTPIRQDPDDPNSPIIDEILVRSEVRCRFLEFGGSQQRTMRGIGPGLEIELDTRRVGPLLLTVFASAQAYKWLGSRSFTIDSNFDATNAPVIPVEHSFSPTLGIPAPAHVPAPGPNDPFGHTPIAPTNDLPSTVSSSGSYELNPWAYRGAVGLRFKWLPE